MQQHALLIVPSGRAEQTCNTANMYKSDSMPKRLSWPGRQREEASGKSSSFTTYLESRMLEHTANCPRSDRSFSPRHDWMGKRSSSHRRG